MNIAIEASNIGSGGGITHLREVIGFVQPGSLGIKRVEVWATKEVLNSLPDRVYLKKNNHSLIEKGIFGRLIWRTFIFPGLARNYDVLFLPAGNLVVHKCSISMSQNLLPFERSESSRYGLSLMRLRLALIRWSQKRSFRQAKGVILLSEYARDRVCKTINLPIQKTRVISHGVHTRFNFAGTRNYNRVNKIVYVSTIDVYKHQWQVVKACVLLWDQGFDFNLDLVGGNYPPSLKKLLNVVQKYPQYAGKIQIIDNLKYEKLPEVYQESDLFVYASTCETFGLTVLEAMASGLPIACSEKSSMKEILSGCGLYFDPLDVKSIAGSIQKLLKNEPLRQELGLAAAERAKQFTWQRSSHETFQFLSECAVS